MGITSFRVFPFFRKCASGYDRVIGKARCKNHLNRKTFYSRLFVVVALRKFHYYLM